MTEAKDNSDKRTRKIKVMIKRPIWQEGGDGKPVKVPQGEKVLLTAEEIKHYGSAVTKDFDDGDE